MLTKIQLTRTGRGRELWLVWRIAPQLGNFFHPCQFSQHCYTRQNNGGHNHDHKPSKTKNNDKWENGNSIQQKLHKDLCLLPDRIKTSEYLGDQYDKSMLQPWQDESELAMVRDWFYPTRAKRDPYASTDSADMRKQALGKVNVWTFKSHRVPHAIIATADLVDSLLHYETFSHVDSQMSYRAVQFMFAFAFMRFVNGFVDRDIARAAAATLAVEEEEKDGERPRRAAGESSMYAHATTIGMPSQFVDLRHQVSHEGLPDLQALKDTSEQALDWLWNRWWRINATGHPGRALRKLEENQQLQHELLQARKQLQDVEQDRQQNVAATS